MSKITSYASLTSPPSGTVLPVVDVTDTTMAPTGTTKQMALSVLDARYDAAGAAAAVSAAATYILRMTTA